MKIWIVVAQVACVVGLTAVVGWPQYRPAPRTVHIWRTNGPLTPQPNLVTDDSRIVYGGGGSVRPGLPSVDAPLMGLDALQGSGFQGVEPAVFGATASRRSMIRGRVRTTINRPVAFARLVLRNRITGQIDVTATADSDGAFAFEDLPPGVYLVELLSADGRVIAATEMATVAGGLQVTTLRISVNGAPRALFGVSASGGSSVPTGAFQPTASEPIGRAAADGAGQAIEPNQNASPRS